MYITMFEDLEEIVITCMAVTNLHLSESEAPVWHDKAIQYEICTCQFVLVVARNLTDAMMKLKSKLSPNVSLTTRAISKRSTSLPLRLTKP